MRSLEEQEHTCLLSRFALGFRSCVLNNRRHSAHRNRSYLCYKIGDFVCKEIGPSALGNRAASVQRIRSRNHEICRVSPS